MQFNNLMDDMVVISSYTRAEAIEDGVLVDVSKVAREAGIKYPVAVTIHLLLNMCSSLLY